VGGHDVPNRFLCGTSDRANGGDRLNLGTEKSLLLAVG
jgi:hypothetical protein